MLVKILGGTTILLLLSVSGFAWVVDDTGCRTPDLGVGECIPVRDCKIIVEFLQKIPQPIPVHIKAKLREYTCGFNAKEIKVCCPYKPMSEMLTHMKMPEEFTKFEEHSTDGGLDLLPKECGYTGIPNKISNGMDANLGEFPWMALLAYKLDNKEVFMCGGTIINDRYILTAAHCITPSKRATLTGVRVGEYDVSKEIDCELQPDGNTKCGKPVQNLKIEKIIPHPNFTKSFYSVNDVNDIGLIRVTPITFTEYVQPICLPTEETKNSKPPTNVVIAGWGFTYANKSSEILQKVNVPLISKKECQEKYAGKIRINDKQICAYGKKKDNCEGDSGGPLQTPMHLNDDIRMVQYGVISFGTRVCGEGAFPGVYTRVDSYMDWILSNIKP